MPRLDPRRRGPAVSWPPNGLPGLAPRIGPAPRIGHLRPSGPQGFTMLHYISNCITIQNHHYIVILYVCIFNYLYTHTHIYIYMCVCKLCNICTNVKLLLLQGPWALGWHGPTKAHPSCCANVPAILFSDRHGTGLSREPLHEKSCLIACYGIQFLTDHYNDPVLVCVSVCVCVTYPLGLIIEII